eukprot:scaffold20576_cov30-Attheya_sp.AAC.2
MDGCDEIEGRAEGWIEIDGLIDEHSIGHGSNDVNSNCSLPPHIVEREQICVGIVPVSWLFSIQHTKTEIRKKKGLEQD